MTQKQKGFVGLGVMVVLAAGLVLGSGPIYKAVSKIGSEKVSYQAGTYAGTAKGFGGQVYAKVTVTESGIATAELMGPDETPDFGGNAIKELAPKFVEAGSAKVDTISGATITSQAAIAAVQQALDQAAGKAEVQDVDTVLAALNQPEEDILSGEIGDYKSEGGLRTGLGVILSTKSSKDAGEKNGSAKVDATVAAVVIDGEGKIVECKVDVLQSNMAFTKEGKVEMKDSFLTKRELKDDYGMRSASGIGKEWYEQGQAFEQYAIGKTAKEIAGIALNESGKPADADLSAGVTVSVGDLQKAVVKAIDSAKEIGTQEGDKLGLAMVSNMKKSADATADKDGQCQAYTTYMAVTVGADNAITGCLIEASQGTVKFDTAGVITSDLSAGVKTKRELGEAYGMKGVSSIGKEWFEQADAMEAYLTGKTKDQVAGIQVDESGKGTDADLTAGVTISITDFMEVAEKALTDAQ